MRIKVKTKDGKKVEGEVIREGDKIKVSHGGKAVYFNIIKTPFGDFIAEDESGRKFRINPIFSSKYEVVFEVNGRNFGLEFVQEGEEESDASKDVFILKAQFSGFVRKVYVKKGQMVRKGETLVDLESMKMINSLKSEIDGFVEEIYVGEGKSVMSGEKIIKVVRKNGEGKKETDEK